MNNLRAKQKRNVEGTSAISAMHLQGGLSLRGYKITDLVKNCIFEEIVYLLLFHRLPTEKELKQLIRNISSQRILPDYLKKTLESIPKGADLLDVQKIIIILLGSFQPEGQGNDQYKVYYRLQGLLGPGLLYWYHYSHSGVRIQIATHEDDTISTNFLKLYHRTDDVDPLYSKVLDTIFSVSPENTFNPSTSAARLNISTKSDIHSSLVSGINAFKGPLHGGAVKSAMQFILSLKSVEHSNQILEEKWKNKELVFGFGHSFYHLKNPDPRVVLTQVYHDELAKKKPFGNPERIEITRNIQKRMVNEKKIAPNCDFSNSVTYDQLGFPIQFLLPMTIISRSTGWYANIIEQRKEKKLLYIYLDYIGPDNKELPKMSERPKL